MSPVPEFVNLNVCRFYMREKVNLATGTKEVSMCRPAYARLMTSLVRGGVGGGQSEAMSDKCHELSNLAFYGAASCNSGVDSGRIAC